MLTYLDTFRLSGELAQAAQPDMCRNFSLLEKMTQMYTLRMLSSTKKNCSFILFSFILMRKTELGKTDIKIETQD